MGNAVNSVSSLVQSTAMLVNAVQLTSNHAKKSPEITDVFSGNNDSVTKQVFFASKSLIPFMEGYALGDNRSDQRLF